MAATIASIALFVGALRIYLEIAGPLHLPAWLVLVFGLLAVLLINAASGLALRATAELEGPIDHAP